jgi:hypothetical protein
MAVMRSSLLLSLVAVLLSCPIASGDFHFTLVQSFTGGGPFDGWTVYHVDSGLNNDVPIDPSTVWNITATGASATHTPGQNGIYSTWLVSPIFTFEKAEDLAILLGLTVDLIDGGDEFVVLDLIHSDDLLSPNVEPQGALVAAWPPVFGPGNTHPEQTLSVRPNQPITIPQVMLTAVNLLANQSVRIRIRYEDGDTVGEGIGVQSNSFAIQGAQSASIIAQFPFAEPNPGRTGAGYEAKVIDANATATDVSLSDKIPLSNDSYIEDPPSGPSYGFTVLRLQPSTDPPLGLGPDSTDPFEAVANDKFFELTVTANPGFGLYLDNLTFEVARGGSSTPRGWVLLMYSSQFGFFTYLDSQEVPSVRNTLTRFTVDLSDSSFQNLPDATFRIYTYVPATDESLDYRNLTLNGTVH